MTLRKILISAILILINSTVSFARDLTLEGKLPIDIKSAVAVSTFSGATDETPDFFAQSANSRNNFSLNVEDKIIPGFLDSNNRYIPTIFAVRKSGRVYWTGEAIKNKVCRDGTARGVIVLKRDLKGAKFGIRKANGEISFAFLTGFATRATLYALFNSSTTVKLSKDCDPATDEINENPGTGNPTSTPTPTATPTPTPTATPTPVPPQIGTTKVTASGNLDSNATGISVSFGLPAFSTFQSLNASSDFQTQISIFDGLGGAHQVKLFFFRDNTFFPTSSVATSWLVRAYVDGAESGPAFAGIPIQLGDTGAMTFAPNGSRVTPAGGIPVIDNAVLPGGFTWNNGAASQAIDFVLEPFTSLPSGSTITSITQDGNGL